MWGIVKVLNTLILIISLLTPKLVTRVVEYVDPSSWKSSPYFRQTDLTTPVKLIFAGDETVCVIWSNQINPVRAGDLFDCKSEWRNAR
jgi:hypothetical protein